MTPFDPQTKAVRFVYLSNKASQGSTAMRAHQLCQMVRPFLADSYDVGLECIHVPPKLLPRSLTFPATLRRWAKRQPAGTVLVFNKACLRVLNKTTLEVLRARDIKICFDHVDSDFRETAELVPDVHVCTSFAQRDAILSHQSMNPSFGGRAMMLLHNYDILLIQQRPAQQDRFRCGYIGNPSLSFLPRFVTDRIEVLSVMGVEGWQQTLDRISNYNLHYCLRLPQPPGSKLIKPFTKGFVAAKLGAPVIVNRETEDAETMLGSDYPYMVERLDEQLVGDMLRKAEDDFGGPTWQLARDRMQTVAAAVAPQALAAQLRGILEFVKD